VSDIDVERLQASLNRFTNRWLENVAPLIVDGEKGFLTNRRIMTVKWYLGYLGERDGKVTSKFVRRMRHPRDPRWSSVRQVLRGIRRRRRQRRRAIEDLDPRPGVSRFDGRPVATWLRRYLVWAREHGWRGHLISGLHSSRQKHPGRGRRSLAPRGYEDATLASPARAVASLAADHVLAPDEFPAPADALSGRRTLPQSSSDSTVRLRACSSSQGGLSGKTPARAQGRSELAQRPARRRGDALPGEDLVAAVDRQFGDQLAQQRLADQAVADELAILC
jgi:hypothetical protein